MSSILEIYGIRPAGGAESPVDMRTAALGSEPSRNTTLLLVEAGIWLVTHLLTFMALLIGMVNRDPALLAVSAAAFPLYWYAIGIGHSETKFRTAKRLWWLPTVAIAIMFLVGVVAASKEIENFFVTAAFLVVLILVMAYFRFARPLLKLVNVNFEDSRGAMANNLAPPGFGIGKSRLNQILLLAVCGLAFLLAIGLFSSALSQ